MACLNLGDSPTDLGFTGQRSDSDFGLMDYNARFYSPRLGRFISPDSIVPDPTSSNGLNRYRYARNSPLRYTDPSGHFSEEQLNYFNIYQEDVAEDIWALLSALEPLDIIRSGDSLLSPIEVVLGAQTPASSAFLYLGVANGDSYQPLTDALAGIDTTDVTVLRNLAGGIHQPVWRNGGPLAEHLNHGLGQSGIVVGPQSARGNRVRDAVSGQLGASAIAQGLNALGSLFLDIYRSINGVWPDAYPPGQQSGDIQLVFTYPDEVYGSNQAAERIFTFRVNNYRTDEPLNLLIDVTWNEMPQLMTPYIVDNNFSVSR